MHAIMLYQLIFFIKDSHLTLILINPMLINYPYYLLIPEFQN